MPIVLKSGILNLLESSGSVQACNGIALLFFIFLVHSEAEFVLGLLSLGIAVAQWLRCCATNQKVAGSIPAGVIGIFH